MRGRLFSIGFLIFLVMSRGAVAQATSLEGCGALSDNEEVRLDRSFAPGQVPVMPNQIFPTIDQGDIKSCYAIVATTMADVYRYHQFWQGKGREKNFMRTSPFFAAALYKNAGSGSVSGSEAESESESESNLELGLAGSSVSGRRISLGEQLGKGSLSETYQLLRDHRFACPLEAPEVRAQNIGRGALSYVNQVLAIKWAAEAPVCSNIKIEDYLQRSLEHCSEEKRLATDDLPALHVVPMQSLGGTTAWLQTSFDDQQSFPIAINYCSNILKSGKYRGVISHSPLALEKNCEQHSSMIIGKRKRKGVCQVLIQNSWGSNCQDERYRGSQHACESGKLWVPVSELSQNLLSVIRF
jgi:hypothetical protein